MSSKDKAKNNDTLFSTKYNDIDPTTFYDTIIDFFKGFKNFIELL